MKNFPLCFHKPCPNYKGNIDKCPDIKDSKYTFKIRKHEYLRKTVLEIKEDGKTEKIIIFNNRKEAMAHAGSLYQKYPGIQQELTNLNSL